jgi:short-subunit dehydrogenase
MITPTPPRVIELHVVITGASSGLGAALARAYARPGVLLTLSGRHEGRLANVMADCTATGAAVAITVCDVTDADGMAAWLIRADQAQPIDILFANAGVGGRAAMAPAGGETNAAAQLIFATNTLGVVNTATPIIPRFMQRRAGRFVVVSSLAGLLGLPHSPAYCGSKAAATTYAEGLRRLLRPHGISVTIVNPGFIDTPMSRSLPVAGPLMWSAERAAIAIKAAVAKRKREFNFPWILRFGIAAARLLPGQLVDAVLARAYRETNSS